jgi:hypothetical protein
MLSPNLDNSQATPCQSSIAGLKVTNLALVEKLLPVAIVGTNRVTIK